jgi:hypothetical protein
LFIVRRSSFISHMPSFEPHRRLRNGHAMTLWAWARRRDFSHVPIPSERFVEVAADARVLAHCYFRRDAAAHPTLIVLHGLEGSSSAHYMRGVAAKGWAAGFNVALLNQRNCGGTEHLTPGLYHSGLTADPRQVIAALTAEERLGPFGVVGYSLGGNLTLKITGELGHSQDPPIAGAVAVCPTMDLERCVRAIERRSNLPYEFNFVRSLRSRLRRKSVHWPKAFDLARLDRIWTIRAFDDAYTAPHHGFGDATNYYYQASSLRVVDRIAAPTLILAAADDPFVPAEQFSDPAVANNPNVTVVVSRQGGHCGFVGAATAGDDGYWAEARAIEFLSRVMPAPHRAP